MSQKEKKTCPAHLPDLEEKRAHRKDVCLHVKRQTQAERPGRAKCLTRIGITEGSARSSAYILCDAGVGRGVI